MKKLIGVGIVFVLAIALFLPIVNAGELQQDDVEIDEEIQNEIRVATYPYGAKIRLLQLEKVLLKSIVKGEIVISFLKNISINTTELEGILTEMKILLEEIRSADANSTNATQEFVDLKYDAIELVKDFREKLHEMVSSEILDELRIRIREAAREQIQNLTNLTIEIRNRIRIFNRNQLHRLYQLIGETNVSILDDYINGNITIEVIKIQICKIINLLTNENRNRIFNELKESNIRAHIRSIEDIEKTKSGFYERRQNRLNNRLNIINNSKNINADVQLQLQNKLKNKIEKGGRGK